jgi:alpha-L-rhamnosidase
VDRPVVAARIHITAHGLYEGFLNGVRIGDAELTPGFTQYDARLQVQTYDITASLRAGPNAIGIVLSDGWYRGQIGITRAADQWGTRIALLAQLRVTHPDGTSTVLGTGPGWRSGHGHVIAADLITGERWDCAGCPGAGLRRASTTPVGRPRRWWRTVSPGWWTRRPRRCGGCRS